MVDNFFKKLEAGEIYIRMPMDEFMRVVNFRVDRPVSTSGVIETGQILKGKKMMSPSSSLIHITLDRQTILLGKIISTGDNSRIINVHVTFFDLDGDWLLGSATYGGMEDSYVNDTKRIFDKKYPIELEHLSMTFEKFLVSTRGSQKQKLLFNKLSNGQINGQQFLMEHAKLTGQNMQGGTRVIAAPSNPPSSAKPSYNARTSRLSYEEAKKQLIKRLMDKEITRKECVKLMGELKVQYGK
ncbi:hypothetical protein N9N13_08895 [Opitutales bacterium]|nr:hypothetical protein [Opitutales bacterium]